MRRTLFVVLSALVLILPACGGGGSPAGPTPVTMPPGPQAAIISIRQSGTAQVCVSPVKQIRVAIPVTFSESAGLGFFVNFASMTLYKNPRVSVESQDIGANDITGALGSNHFAGRSSTAVNVHFDFNHSDFDSALVTFNFTDDHGNTSEASLPGVSPVVALIFCTI